MQRTPTKSDRSDEQPIRTWSTTVADLGGLALSSPLTVTLEDYGEEFIASWPEVEAFGSGTTEAEAINALKDEVCTLYSELASTPADKLGKLPRRWKQTLCAVAHPNGL